MGQCGKKLHRRSCSVHLECLHGTLFQPKGSFNSIDFRFDATNALNHVTYPSWNTTITSAQFGLPMSANAMRVLQATLRVRF